MDNSYPLKSVHSSGQKRPLHRETSENNEIQPEAKRPKYTPAPHTEAYPGKKAITQRTTTPATPATPAIGHWNNRHYMKNFNAVTQNLSRHCLHSETDESVNIQSTVNQQKHTLTPHTESPSEQKVAIDRKADYGRSANSPTLEQRLQTIPSGAAGNQKQAEMELQKVQYQFTKNRECDSEQFIRCRANYCSGTKLKASVIIIFKKNSWNILWVDRDKKIAFYMNDFIRHVYMNTETKSSFDISHPTHIIIGSITDKAIIKQLAINSATKGRSRQKIETLYPSPLGKLSKRILDDFGFHADYYNEIAGDAWEYIKLKKIGFMDAPCIEIPLKKNDSHPVN